MSPLHPPVPALGSSILPCTARQGGGRSPHPSPGLVAAVPTALSPQPPALEGEQQPLSAVFFQPNSISSEQ